MDLKINATDPFSLGLFLSDLTFLEDGNPDTVTQCNLINFDKWTREAAIFSIIKKFQSSEYCLQPQPVIQKFLHVVNGFGGDKELYKVSQEREAKLL
jgi:hypothetical protein